MGVAEFGAGEIARGLAAEGEAGAFEIAEAALLDGLLDDGVMEVGGEFEGGGELFERGAVGGFDGDLARGVAGAQERVPGWVWPGILKRAWPDFTAASTAGWRANWEVAVAGFQKERGVTPQLISKGSPCGTTRRAGRSESCTKVRRVIEAPGRNQRFSAFRLASGKRTKGMATSVSRPSAVAAMRRGRRAATAAEKSMGPASRATCAMAAWQRAGETLADGGIRRRVRRRRGAGRRGADGGVG